MDGLLASTVVAAFRWVVELFRGWQLDRDARHAEQDRHD